MLVLSRRQGESLRIDENIRITLVACSAGQVRLAIDAPDHIEILREEVYERIASANLAAAGTPDGAVRRAVTRLRGSSGSRTKSEGNRKGGQHG